MTLCPQSEPVEVVKIVLVVCVQQEAHLVKIIPVLSKVLLEIAVNNVDISPPAIEDDADNTDATGLLPSASWHVAIQPGSAPLFPTETLEL